MNLSNEVEMILLSKVPKDWVETRGEGIKIGVVDSGCDVAHKNLNISEYRVFGQENLHHGTHIAGIISSNAKNYSINGFCHKSEIIFAACDFVNFQSLSHLIKSLEWIKEKNVDVLNLSFALKKDYEQIKKILKEISEKTIICCSYSKDLPYPHSYDFVISVGKNKTDKADIIAPSKFVSTSPNNGYSELSGSSMATAFVTSVFGLAKSYDKKISKDSILIKISGEKIYIPEKNIFSTNNKQIIFKRKK